MGTEDEGKEGNGENNYWVTPGQGGNRHRTCKGGQTEGQTEGKAQEIGNE